MSPAVSSYAKRESILTVCWLIAQRVFVMLQSNLSSECQGHSLCISMVLAQIKVIWTMVNK